MSVALWGRNLPYLASRMRSVGTRYGITPRKARERVRRCVSALARYGMRPTFATPGRVVDEDPEFFRELVARGVELAVHGYDHVDFRGLSREEARAQFDRAIEAYARHGIVCDGFRCPYLSYTPALHDVLPERAFLYSSNRAIAWYVEGVDPGNPVFAQLATFYSARTADEELSLPSLTGDLVEIPASVPDDLELCDGLGLGEDGLAEAWLSTFEQVHRRGELFSPLFHPESYDLLAAPLQRLLARLASEGQAVWRTQLRDVAQWWRERCGFRVNVASSPAGLEVRVSCSDRATLLARDWSAGGAHPWHGRWSALEGRSVRVHSGIRPFVGVRGADRRTVAFLKEQGYIVDESDGASSCTVVLDETTVTGEVALVAHIESTSGPLLKFPRWPDGAVSAFCFAGDLDALSLRDYAMRIVRRSRLR